MKTIKKNLGAILFIGTILIINTILWVGRIQSAYLTSEVLQTSLIGSLLLMGFFLVFLLSTRMNWLVKLFGGLEGLYFWHRTLAIVTTALILVHAEFAVSNALSYNVSIPLLGYAGSAGELARNGFFLLVFVALLAKFIKYEHFRFIHRLLIIPYFISLYHSFYSSWVNLFQMDALSLWMLLTSAIGLGSSLYMILLYPRTAFSHRGIIESKTLLTESIIELKIKMDRNYRFKPGQFAFIKIDADGISESAHPFSISGSDGKYLYFTIKSLGDFTNSLLQTMETPTRIRITRAFGKMTFRSKHTKQIWIAGGIGVTPFLGYLRSDKELKSDVHLYYSVRYESEAVHLDTFQILEEEQEHFKFTLFEASKQGFLTANDLDINDDTIVYMCGPRPMALALHKQIKEMYPGVRIEFEAFSFTGTLVEDILKSYKKVLRKLKPAART
ncbi:MAG: ferric reductase-like transmembrane domain-containing protein [Bacilli bacterium]|nr:ferric reductase-like transmembrane domain-containing protein [Bacilli bacterium]MBN2876296.1 ferric reductase-like transmembrane domain-containing protein [Bacilli bacterium]